MGAEQKYETEKVVALLVEVDVSVKVVVVTVPIIVMPRRFFFLSSSTGTSSGSCPLNNSTGLLREEKGRRGGRLGNGVKCIRQSKWGERERREGICETKVKLNN